MVFDAGKRSGGIVGIGREDGRLPVDQSTPGLYSPQIKGPGLASAELLVVPHRRRYISAVVVRGRSLYIPRPAAVPVSLLSFSLRDSRAMFILYVRARTHIYRRLALFATAFYLRAGRKGRTEIKGRRET